MKNNTKLGSALAVLGISDWIAVLLFDSSTIQSNH